MRSMYRWMVSGLIGCLVWAPAWATVELNRANQAELEMVTGIGPQLSEQILAERQQRPFTHWADFIARLRGIGPARARKLSEAGLTVNQQPYAPPAGASAPR